MTGSRLKIGAPGIWKAPTTTGRWSGHSCLLTYIRFDDKIQNWLDAPTVGAGFKPAPTPLCPRMQYDMGYCLSRFFRYIAENPTKAGLPYDEYWLYRGGASHSSVCIPAERQ